MTEREFDKFLVTALTCCGMICIAIWAIFPNRDGGWVDLAFGVFAVVFAIAWWNTFYKRNKL